MFFYFLLLADKHLVLRKTTEFPDVEEECGRNINRVVQTLGSHIAAFVTVSMGVKRCVFMYLCDCIENALWLRTIQFGPAQVKLREYVSLS